MNYPIKSFGEFDGRVQEMTLTWFEHSDESVFVIAVEPDRFIIEALNPAHERRTGLRNSMIAGKAPHEFLPAATADAITANYRRCVEAGETIRYDEVLDLGTGSRHWQTVLTPIRDPSGCIRHILGSARDVTEERENRRQAEQARGLLQDLIEASPDILHVFDLETGGSTLIGGRAGDILGWSQNDLAVLRSNFVTTLIHPADVAAVAEHLRALRFLARKDMATVEFRMRRADGGYVWLRSRQRPFARGDDGCVSKVFGSACSIQEYKEAEAELRATNERLTSTLASIAECYFTLGRDYRISGVNRACLEWLGCDPADVVGQSYWDFCRPEDVCGATTKRAMEERRPVQRELRSAVRPDRWLDFRVFPSEEGVTVFFRDITDAMLARSEEKRAKGLLQATLDSLSAHIAILDTDATIVAVNRAWRSFADQNLYPASHKGLGQNYLAVCQAVANECPDARRMAQGLSDLLAGRSSEFRMEYLFGDRWFIVRAARFEHEGATHVVVAHEDVTDLNQAKRDLAESAERLLNLQDEERRRIGVELHDSTSQHLTAASLGLAAISRTGRSDTALFETIGGISEALDEAQREIRTFSYLLHPPQLDRDGLAATLRDFVLGFARRAGLVARTRIDTAIDDVETGIRKATLRIVQEALANVRRHAQASRVTVEVRVKDGVLRMRIADDGRGIPTSHSADPRPRLGVGIPGMQARVRQFGGELGIATGSRGTTIRAVIPLSGSQGFRQ
jgi:PAS domain S-box-containing protein